jgi:hypothetical protein
VKLFGLDIAKIAADSIKSAGGILDCTLIKELAGNIDTTDISGKDPKSKKKFKAKGVISEYSRYDLANSLVKAGDRKITLLAATIDGGRVPEAQDKIQILEKEYRIVGPVTSDPANATYTCQCRE